MKIPTCWQRTFVVIAFCIAAVTAAPAQIFTVIHRFDGTDGISPVASLLQGIDGNLYGTTVGGGAHLTGTLFKLTPAGRLTTIYNFCAVGPCFDGASPEAALMQGLNGSFYGTTEDGGQNAGGTVFRITPQGRLTTLGSFCATVNCADGAQPQSALVRGSDRNFYGTTLGGGANGNHGTVFRLNAAGGGLTTIYSFCALAACADGEAPRSGLVEGADGSFYGTTASSGVNNSGTVFKITSGGELTTIYSFCVLPGCPDGAAPVAGIVQGGDGNFYGVTALGGGVGNCVSGCGTVFRLTAEGTLTTLYRFASSDGARPVGLLQASDGNLYGTTEFGGTHDQGTVFRLNLDGTLKTLHNFTESDGVQPEAGLVQAIDGSLYGTTALGGSGNRGTIFRMRP